MSETKTYVFPESGGNGGGSGMMAMLAPLLQQKGIDPYGEEIQYIGDDIIEKTWEYAKTLLCECDCCKNKVKHLIR